MTRHLAGWMVFVVIWGITVWAIPADAYQEEALWGLHIHAYTLVFSALSAVSCWGVCKMTQAAGQSEVSAGVFQSATLVLLAAGIYYTILHYDYFVLVQEDEFRPQLFTPIYAGVLGILFCNRHKWSIFMIFYFIALLSFVHFYAISSAAFSYDKLPEMFTGPLPLVNGLVLQSELLVPGFVGGFFGSVMCFLGLSLIVRAQMRWIFILSAAVLLGLIGAIGLSLPDQIAPNPFFWLYIPWQLVFGTALVQLAKAV